MQKNTILFDLYKKHNSVSHRLEKIEYDYICDNSALTILGLSNKFYEFQTKQNNHESYKEYKVLLDGIGSLDLANILQGKYQLEPVLRSAAVAGVRPGQIILDYNTTDDELFLRVFDGFNTISISGSDYEVPNYRALSQYEGYPVYGVLIIPSYTYVEPK